MNAIPPVVLKATAKHTATLIFLHGLGDTGFGWAGALRTIQPAFMKVICPTAPLIPVTVNGGATMPAWYDILTLDPVRQEIREDQAGVDESVKFLHGLVQSEIDNAGLSSERVMVGGFSQGGAVSLVAALSWTEPLAGCMALSSYLPGSGRISPGNTDTPVWQAHGDRDEMVPYKRGQLTAQVLKELMKEHTFLTYKGMGHEGTQEELNDMQEFIHQKLG